MLDLRLPYLSDHIWVMWLTKYHVVVGSFEDEIYLTKRGTTDTLRIPVGVPDTGEDEVHHFDYLLALADKISWSSETNILLGKFLGATATTDLMDRAKAVTETELYEIKP